jgi:ketosteroid isomerase-like protein
MDRVKSTTCSANSNAAQARGKLDRLCKAFTEGSEWRIAGANHGTRVAVDAKGVQQICSWLTLMIKTLKVSELEVLSIIHGGKAAAHWRARISSRITGAVGATEFVHILQVRENRIASYIEFLAPCEG